MQISSRDGGKTAAQRDNARPSESLTATSARTGRSRRCVRSFPFAEANPWLQPAFSSTTWTKRPILARGHPAPQQNISQGLPALPLFSPQTPRFRPRATLPSRGGRLALSQGIQGLEGIYLSANPRPGPSGGGFCGLQSETQAIQARDLQGFQSVPGSRQEPPGAISANPPTGRRKGAGLRTPGSPPKGG